MRGAVYVAYGDAARSEAAESIASLREHNDLPVFCISDVKLDATVDGCCIGFPGGKGARWAKLQAEAFVQDWDQFVYIDADTRIRGDITAGFDILDDGWDIAMTPSANQDDDAFWHIGDDEMSATINEIGNPYPLQLQCGMMFVNRNERTMELYDAWREEWLRWRDQDQAAFIRALHQCPVRLWLLGRPWNGGAMIRHRFGAIRGRG
jgi:hypothetical protein